MKRTLLLLLPFIIGGITNAQGIKINAGAHPSMSVTWPISADSPMNVIVRDSTGFVAYRDSSGKWSFTDAARALEVEYKLLTENYKRLQLLSSIVQCIDEYGSVHNFELFMKSIKEYYEYLNQKK